MNFDDYWKNLVNRVYHQQARLEGNEDCFYRLSCVYGETMVDGIEAYFERRFDEFDLDMNAIRSAKFDELASEFELASNLLFGTLFLNRELVETTISGLLKETRDSKLVLEELDKIYERIIPQLENLTEYTYSFGLTARLFENT